MMFERLFRPKTTRIELDLTDAQIVQLRTVMDGLPFNPYIGLVVAVVKKLPLDHGSDRNQAEPAPSDAAVDTPTPRGSLPNSLGADPQVHTTTPRGPAGGFFLHTVTPKGAAQLPEIERLLARLPHGGDGSL